MFYSPDEEARFELALSTSLLNEIKFGSQLSHLAEAMLLSAFRTNQVNAALHQQMKDALPAVRYISLAAFLNGGVVIRSTNLLTEGEVTIRAQAMGQSAARIAAKQHSIFHGQKKSGEPIKLQELQEAWDHQQCTSTVSVPIPASRHFEDAFIPYADRHLPPPERGTCPVLYAANGTVGVLHFGLSTEDVKLNGSQGRRFVGLAQSFGPHLGYLVAPVLESLQPQIRAVAASIASQQETRRRSMSCALPPVEQLTVHDSAESLTSQLPSRFSPAGQQARQQRPPAPTGSATPRMLSPFQTYTAPATASSQPASPETQSSRLQTEQQQDRSESGSGGSGRLDLSPAKTALDMSLLDVARLGNRIAHRQPPGASDSVSSVPRRMSGEPIRRLSAGESETAAIVAGKAAEALRRNSRSSELELDAQPSTEYYPQQEAVIAASSKGPAKPHRRPPLPLMRASSPLSVHGPEPSTNAMPRQMSLHLPEASGPQKHTQGVRAPGSLSPFQQDAFSKGPSQGGAAPTSGPFAQAASQEGIAFTSPFATSAPFETEGDQFAASAATTAASLLPEGSVINMSSLLPPLPSQQPAFSPCRLSPLAVASLTASLPQEISSSAAAVLSAPMTSLQPATHYTGVPGLTMPSMLPASDVGMQTVSPRQQTGFTMSPAPYAEEQQRGHSQQQGYRLPPQLQSSSLLLQLLPAGSAQSLTALMSRQASDATPISRTSSLNNDGSTSVHVSSPKRSLLNMSRAVSEQLHLSHGSRGAQRPFLADLQERWIIAGQQSGELVNLVHSLGDNQEQPRAERGVESL